MPPMTAFARRLAGIVAVGVLLRLLVVLAVPTVPESDFLSYHSRAVNLLDTGTYGVRPGVADATWPPLYPLSLALVYGLAGRALLAAKLWNVALAGLFVAGMGLLGRSVWGERVGLAAAAIAALYPRLLLLPVLLASENLFGVLLLGWFLAMARSWRSPRPVPHAVLGGVLLGLAALTRSAAYPLAPLWALAAGASGKRWRRAAAEGLLVLLVQHAVMVPWALRNQRALGGISFTTTAAGMSLFIGNNPNATGHWYDPVEDFRAVIRVHGRSQGFERDRLYRRLALEWMRDHPGDALTLYGRKLAAMHADERYAVLLALGPESAPAGTPLPVPEAHPLRARYAGVAAAVDASYYLLVAAILAGLGLALRDALRSGRRRQRAALVALAGGAVALTLLGALFFGNARFRWPAHDLLLPFAAIAAVSLAERARSRPGAPGGGATEAAG
jgi:4-amino-4-deoxy-L-arabinose transferase-like glycosyltransferase